MPTALMTTLRRRGTAYGRADTRAVLQKERKYWKIVQILPLNNLGIVLHCLNQMVMDYLVTSINWLEEMATQKKGQKQ